MELTIIEYVLPRGKKRYHEHVFPDTPQLQKILEHPHAFEFEQLRTGHLSLEIAIYGDADDVKHSEIRLITDASQVAATFEQMVITLGDRL